MKAFFHSRKASLIPLLAAVLTASPLLSQQESTHTVAVKGSAQLRKAADELRLQVGIVNEAETATKALGNNSSKMQAVIAALIELGIEKGEYETGRFSLRPLYSERPEKAPRNWQPHIIGYEVSNRLSIRTSKLALAASIIDKATQAGANNIEGLTFTLGDMRKHRAEAIAVATQNAIEDAEVLSASLGVALGKITSVTLGDEFMTAPSSVRYYAKSTALDSSSLEPGEVDVTATVAVEYEIAQ